MIGLRASVRPELFPFTFIGFQLLPKSGMASRTVPPWPSSPRSLMLMSCELIGAMDSVEPPCSPVPESPPPHALRTSRPAIAGATKILRDFTLPPEKFRCHRANPDQMTLRRWVKRFPRTGRSQPPNDVVGALRH